MARKGAVEFTGPFFDARADETLRQNIRHMIQGMADEGESAVKGIVAPHSRSGALSGSIHGRTRSLSGKQWALTGVISSNLNEIIAKLKGQTSGNWRGSYAGFIETGLRINDRIKVGVNVQKSLAKGRTVYNWQRRKVKTTFSGYHMFRSVARGLNNSRAAATANLTKGLE